MNELTKKRVMAMGIDTVMSSVVSSALEPLVKKKVKGSFVPIVILPYVVLWGIEAAQISLFGQTLGQRAVGIKIITEDGGKPEAGQILKRSMHRDSVSAIPYLKNRKAFDANGGIAFPHDQYAETLVVVSK